MITPASLLIARCGLSHREAADFLGVRLDTVKSWSSGRNQAPDGAIAELRALYAKIEFAATAQLKLMVDLERAHGDASVIDLKLARDDDQARKRGWPCIGAQAAAYGIAIAKSSAVFRIVTKP